MLKNSSNPKKKRLINKEIANIDNINIKFFSFRKIVELISLFLNQKIPPLKAANKLYKPDEKYGSSLAPDNIIIVNKINNV